MLEAWKAHRKPQIVYEIAKIAVLMHSLIFYGEVRGAKNARHCSQTQYFGPLAVRFYGAETVPQRTQNGPEPHPKTFPKTVQKRSQIDAHIYL